MPESHNRCSWSAWIGSERDSDGEPDTIHVAPSDGAHVTETDAEWVRRALSAEETLTELQTWLNRRVLAHRRAAAFAKRHEDAGAYNRCIGREDDAQTTLDWLETKRSGNG